MPTAWTAHPSHPTTASDGHRAALTPRLAAEFLAIAARHGASVCRPSGAADGSPLRLGFLAGLAAAGTSAAAGLLVSLLILILLSLSAILSLSALLRLLLIQHKVLVLRNRARGQLSVRQQGRNARAQRQAAGGKTRRHATRPLPRPSFSNAHLIILRLQRGPWG